MRKTRTPRFEALEPRRCLAWITSVDGTALTFEGTDEFDKLTNIRADAGAILYDDEDGVGRIAAGLPGVIDLIVIYGHEGDDEILVATGSAGFAVAAEFTIFGGDGGGHH